MSDGHGLIRLELRYDHLPESTTFIGVNMVSVKFGFDLLVGGK